MVVSLFDGLNTLISVSVRDMLQTDPTNSVDILAPGGIEFLLGTLLGPRIMDWRAFFAPGVAGLIILGLGFILLGFIDHVAPILDAVLGRSQKTSDATRTKCRPRRSSSEEQAGVRGRTPADAAYQMTTRSSGGRYTGSPGSIPNAS